MSEIGGANDLFDTSREVGSMYAYIELSEFSSESRARGREVSLRSSTLSHRDDHDDGKDEEREDDDLRSIEIKESGGDQWRR